MHDDPICYQVEAGDGQCKPHWHTGWRHAESFEEVATAVRNGENVFDRDGDPVVECAPYSDRPGVTGWVSYAYGTRDDERWTDAPPASILLPESLLPESPISAADEEAAIASIMEALRG